jgi:hypothetical protein
MRLFPEIRVPFGRRTGNTGSPLTDEIDSGIRKILEEELLPTRPAIAADEGLLGLQTPLKRVLEPFRRLSRART